MKYTAEPKRIFVSHPYSGDPHKNKLANAELIYNLHKQYPDYVFISPLMLFDYMDDDSMRDEIMDTCKDIIMYVCDELWVYGDSEGCRQEKEYASMVGMKIKEF